MPEDRGEQAKGKAMSEPPHEYDDVAMHVEDCGYCRTLPARSLCAVGKRIEYMQGWRDKKGSKR